MSRGAHEVTLIDAWRDSAAAAFFRNVWPLYVHEITAFDTDFYRLDERGRWQPDIVEDWLALVTPDANLRERRDSRDAGQPFQRTSVIASAGRAVGFVSIGLPPFRYMPEDADVCLCELFVSRWARGGSVARAAVQQLLPRHPGRWTLRAIHDNARAIAFWSTTLLQLGVGELQRSEQHGDVIWSFRVGVGAGSPTA